MALTYQVACELFTLYVVCDQRQLGKVCGPHVENQHHLELVDHCSFFQKTLPLDAPIVETFVNQGCKRQHKRQY